MQFTRGGHRPRRRPADVRRRWPSLPAGAQLNAQTGEFHWTPDFDQAGDYTLHLGVRDPAGLSATPRRAAPHRQRQPAADARRWPNHSVLLGQSLTFTLAGADPDAGTTLTYAARGLPDGATLDPHTGAFAWTPRPGRPATTSSPSPCSDGEATVEQSVVLRASVSRPPLNVTIELTPSFPAVPGQQVLVHAGGRQPGPDHRPDPDGRRPEP